MRVMGFYKRGAKDYVIFEDDKGKYKATDGFHDRAVRDIADYQEVGRNEVDLQKIVSRLRGARSWHPLLGELREVSGI